MKNTSIGLVLMGILAISIMPASALSAMFDGGIYYSNGTACTNIDLVEITNLNTSAKWNKTTIPELIYAPGSSSYQLTIEDPQDIGSGNTLQYSAQCEEQTNTSTRLYSGSNITHDIHLGQPDLIPTAIKPYHFEWWEEYNVPKGDPWFNLTNYVNVTVKNNGSGSASSFKVKLYADDELIGEKTISGLSAGSSTEEKFEWKPTGNDPMSWVDTANGSKVTYTTTDRTYTLKAVVDEANEIPEENDANNNLTKSQKVVWNGYTGDQPLENYMHGSVKGGMFYTTGDGAYQGVGNPGTTYGTYYNVSYNLEIPGTPKLSRLYIYYTWAQSPHSWRQR